MLHYQNVNEVSEATGDQTSEIPLTENHHGIGQNFMLTVRLPVLGLHGKKMLSFNKNHILPKQKLLSYMSRPQNN